MVLAEMPLFILLREVFTRGLVCARLPFPLCGLNSICNLLWMAQLLSSLLSITSGVPLQEGQVAELKLGSGSCSPLASLAKTEQPTREAQGEDGERRVLRCCAM